MRHTLAAALSAGLLLSLPAAPALAGEPFMPLSEVRTGSVCQAASVIRGESVTTFNAEVLDVIVGPQPDMSRILIRVSGPAVDETGVGPGFSGSPVRCPRADGSFAIAGAISEGIGEYGGKVLLATPIEPILAEPIDPPLVRPRTAPKAPVVAVTGATPLAGPLTLAGISGPVASTLRAAAKKAGRQLITTGARPRQAPALGGTPTPFVPGSAVFAGLSSGQVGLGALGTVAYTDGAKTWAFGHPFDGAGRRALFMQTARISSIIFNPVGTAELSTYKLGEPVADAGIVSGDGVSAITGTTGIAPPSYPMRVLAQDLQTGRNQTLTARIADESTVGQPSGVSAFGIVSTATAGTLASTVLKGGTPGRSSGEMCVRLRVKQVKRELRFCNRYVMGAGTPAMGIASPVMSDLTSAAGLLDSYEFAPIEPTDLQIALRLRRGTTQSFVDSVDAPSTVRRGRTYTLRLRLRRATSGRVTTKRIRFRVPRSAPRGSRLLTVTGPGAELSGGEDELFAELGSLFGLSEGSGSGGPDTPNELAEAFEDLGRYDGLTLSFPSEEDLESEDPEDAEPDDGTELYRDPQLRLSGQARTPVTVR
ncbi:MAG: hypothetical protein JHC95_20205 [Solirubrobacteraceae bacterium]|nr:hypothetical protein [Solirubrobacteraceae bacterium]